MDKTSKALAEQLAEAGRGFYARGWVLGTSGNFSAVLSREPLQLLITPSGADKGRLEPSQFLTVDAHGKSSSSDGKPSDETLLHLAIVRQRGAGAVLHTHSVWSTMLSEAFAADGGLWISGYEMQKGLEGVRSHTHREWLPILENSQDLPALSAEASRVLQEKPDAHGLLLRAHGLYTWGADLAEARRHVEILEFLLEVVGRTHSERRG